MWAGYCNSHVPRNHIGKYVRKIMPQLLALSTRHNNDGTFSVGTHDMLDSGVFLEPVHRKIFSGA